MSELRDAINEMRNMRESYDQLASAATAYNEGKPALAAAITAKGQATEPTASLATMAENVGLIQQETYELQGSELYEKQMFGAAMDTSDPYVQEGSPLWNLYAVMVALKSDARFVNYGGILLAEYFKGYDSIELMNVGAGGAYFTCDGDYYTTDRASANPHVWHDGDNGKMTRWVAYLFASERTNYTIPSTNLCPRSIHIGRKVGTIISNQDGRISEIVVTDGNELYSLNLYGSQNWNQKNVIKNIKTHTAGSLMGTSTGVFVEIGIESATDIILNGGSTQYIFNNLQFISFPRLKAWGVNSAIISSSAYCFQNVVEVRADSMEEITGSKGLFYAPYSGASFGNLQYIKLPSLARCTTMLYLLEQSRGSAVKLIDVEVGEMITNLNCRYWNPTTVIADPTKLVTLNENIRNHIAAKVSDRTGQSALTFTVSTNLYNNLEQATKDAFTAKGWICAGA